MQSEEQIIAFWDDLIAKEKKRQRERKRTRLRRMWDAKHLESVGCKLPTDTAQRFKRYCDDLGMTRYAVLQAAVVDMLRRNGY